MTGENTIANRPPGKITPEPYQILCLSGGGFRGLYTAALLEILEAQAQKPLSRIFNLIAGTSIGGILALGLATGIPAGTLRSAFEANADLIFPRYRKIGNWSVFPRFPLGLFKARYPQTGLRKTIENIFVGQSHAKLCNGLATDVLICSVDLNGRGPRIFRSADKNCDVTLVDVALATSAAPTYFPEHSIGSNLLVDGGLIANAPDMIALLEALKSESLANVRMLSLGTAGREGARPFRRAKAPGLIGSAKDTFFLTLDGVEQRIMHPSRNKVWIQPKDGNFAPLQKLLTGIIGDHRSTDRWTVNKSCLCDKPLASRLVASCPTLSVEASPSFAKLGPSLVRIGLRREVN